MPIELVDSLASIRKTRDPVAGTSAIVKRIVMMAVAGAEPATIAQWLKVGSNYVSHALASPAGRQLYLQMSGQVADDMRPAIQEVNEMVAASTKEAFQAEIDTLRFAKERMTEDLDVKAGMLCHNVASSILDRAGAAAPKKLETTTRSVGVSVSHTEHMVKVLKELDEIA